jgi:hypothetical protein
MKTSKFLKNIRVTEEFLNGRKTKVTWNIDNHEEIYGTDDDWNDWKGVPKIKKGKVIGINNVRLIK